MGCTSLGNKNEYGQILLKSISVRTMVNKIGQCKITGTYSEKTNLQIFKPRRNFFLLCNRV